MTDPLATEPSSAVLERHGTTRIQGRYSPDGRWLGLVTVRPDQAGVSKLGVTSATGAPDRAAVSIAAEHSWVDKPRWSPDGRTLYFLADHAGSSSS